MIARRYATTLRTLSSDPRTWSMRSAKDGSQDMYLMIPIADSTSLTERMRASVIPSLRFILVAILPITRACAGISATSSKTPAKTAAPSAS